jgi:SAM-dependent methyltransferase
MTTSPNNLYDLPLYYDIAFSWSLSKEAGFLIRALKYHGNRGKLEKILEPACGTGRMLREFAGNGVPGTGYDISIPCVDYAIKRNQKLGLDDKIDVVCDDMATACFGSPFDGAFNLVGSFTYLVSERKVIG